MKGFFKYVNTKEFVKNVCLKFRLRSFCSFGRVLVLFLRWNILNIGLVTLLINKLLITS